MEKEVFIITDWAGNHLFKNKEFSTFEDGWDFIYENVTDEEEYEDLFVINKKDFK